MTDRKHQISIVIPTVSEKDKVGAIAESYVKSLVKDKLSVQFVYLVNVKNPPPGLPKNEINQLEDYEEIIVRSDRYFGSCEENLYRIRDFLPALKPWVVVMGDHDAIMWDALVLALDFAVAKQVDILGINLLNEELKNDHSYESCSGLTASGHSNAANQIVLKLWNGEVLNSQIAYPAMISMYGPVDWVCYLGSHIYSREAMWGFLQYRFSEWAYSLVYMQASFFRIRDFKYAFFSVPVFQRIADDFLRYRNNQWKSWLQDHRTVMGNSKIFWIANLSHLNQLEDIGLFTAITLGISLRHVDHGGIKIVRDPTLVVIFEWCRLLIEEQMRGTNYYFPGQSSPNFSHDIRYIVAFNKKLLWILQKNPDMFGIIGHDFVSLFLTITNSLEKYLLYNRQASEESDKGVLSKVHENYQRCAPLITMDKTDKLLDIAFQQLLGAA